MLATASRDGAIRVWDRRVAGEALSSLAGSTPRSVATVNQIKNAHGVKGKGSKGVRADFFPTPIDQY